MTIRNLFLRVVDGYRLRVMSHENTRGMTFIEVIFTIGIVMMVFIAIYGVFIVSIQIVTSAKSRAGGLALVTERMEQARSQPYYSLGTVNGIPSGNIAQSESVSLNNIAYVRRTLIEYADDPADGSGASDSNGITTDYKRIKVEVTWFIRGQLRSVALVGQVIPTGIESVAGGGTLKIQAFDAFASPISGASVHIVNNTGSTTVDVTTYTDATGQVLFPGTPSGAGYQITVTKAGYSTSQTYSANTSNPNPNPGHLSIATSQTTSSSFFIDRLSSLTVSTFKPIEEKIWSDTFMDDSQLQSQASTTVSGGALILTDTGGIFDADGVAKSVPLAPTYLYKWKSFTFAASSSPGTSVRVRVLHDTGGSLALVPDSVIPGNSGGFLTSPVSLLGVSTSTYAALILQATLSTSDTALTPSVQSWTITYEKGPVPLPNLAFSMRGNKTIGTNSSGQSIYKFSNSLSTDGAGTLSTTTLEWDTYTPTVSASTGYDISEACMPLPLSISPNTSNTLNLFLSPHTTNSLLFSVSDQTTSVQLSGVSVRLTNTGVDTTQTTSSCGQTFFPSLTSASTYTLTISKSGYQNKIINNVSISGQTTLKTTLTP